MSHFAKIEDGIVTQVIVAEQDFIDTYHSSETWVQTSYNTRNGIHYGQDGEPDGGIALRYNYAGIDYIYDEDNDVFYPPQPYESWTLDTKTWLWVAPITYPDDGNLYDWNEDLYQSDNTKGWVEE